MHLFGVDLLYPDRQSLDAVHNDTITFFTYLCRGGSIPQVLIEKAEEYLPDDIRFLIKFVKVSFVGLLLYVSTIHFQTLSVMFSDQIIRTMMVIQSMWYLLGYIQI
jgi:hypothetical protein